MTIGTCYFPEHWPRERWETDVKEMADAGIEYVRMAEFSWAEIEPSRGEFDFEWLEDAVELIGDHGMQAVLCTPTATPPKWLVDEHPDIRQEDPDGTVMDWGSRRHYCFNSPTFRAETERIVTVMAERFTDNPHVAGWQTDNEYGCHGTAHCYCDDCAAAFREWLRERYGDAETLNERWGTSFWSQRYDSIDQLDVPRPTPYNHHPSHLLDYNRFSSDSVVDYNRLQADLLRDVNDDWFVTHNFMSEFGGVDVNEMRDDLDFSAWDSYPTGHVQEADRDLRDAEFRVGNPDQLGLNHDLYRAPDAPHWIMEQQPGDVNWPPHSPQPGEGAMRLWAHWAVAHGADEVLYFRWRRCREGQEQYHAGLRKQDGTPDRGYHDAAETSADLDALALDPVEADVAILHDFENMWALGPDRHSPDFSYWAHLKAYYRALRARGATVTITHPSADLDRYDAVVGNNLYLADDELAAHLDDYVSGGGDLLLTMRAGVKDRANKLHEDLTPGPLANLVGARVDQHESVPAQMETRATYDGETHAYRTWAEWLDPDAAAVVGRHETGVAAGEPAITRNEVDDGSVTYVGLWPEADLADRLVTDLLHRADVPTTDRLPEGVRFAERDGLTWVGNFTEGAVSVDAPADAEYVVGDETVPSFDVSVVRAAPHELSVD
ncbi:MAG: beta-galactosidase [Halobacteriaceae archaeon]